MASGLAGVDVASFQGTPAQWKTAAGNIAWAAVKLTELQPGTRYVNPDAAADWAYLKAQGLGRVAYLFGHPSVSATDTVAFFAARLGELGVTDGDAICLDHEVADGLSPARAASWAGDVMANLHARFGRPPLLYTFRSFAAAGNCAGLGSWPLWISDPSHPVGRPQVPAPWKTFVIHQYQTSGGIDRDFAAWPSLAAMRAALGRTPAPVVPVPLPDTALEAPEMILVRVDMDTVPSGTAWPGVFLVGGGTLHHVTSGADQASYVAAGIKGPVLISYQEYAGWAAGE